MAAQVNAFLNLPENQPMNRHLEDHLGIDNNYLRANIIRSGFNTASRLINMRSTIVGKIATNVRKMPSGTTGQKHVTVEVEEDLERTAIFSRYTFVTQRQMDFQFATKENLNTLFDWYVQQAEDPSTDTVSKFSDSSNKREWFESIQNYLSEKKGAIKMPLLYVIRAEDPVVTNPNDIWGQAAPDFNEDLRTRARHDGCFWKADNTAVWPFLHSKCHGTTAWTTISIHEKEADGRKAYLSLIRQYMGPDIQRVLACRAEQFLEHAHFDNKSRNFTYDKFVGRMRQAFIDLGPEDKMSEKRKVTKLMQAWQVDNLKHLDAMVTGDPVRSTNFEEAAAFLGDQMTALQTKNQSNRRNISSLNQCDKFKKDSGW